MEARNANYAAVVRNLQFTKRAWFGLRIADEPEDSRRQHVLSDSDSTPAAALTRSWKAWSRCAMCERVVRKYLLQSDGSPCT